MSGIIKAISHKEYLNTSTLRNSYNDTLAMCHLYNYGCVFVENVLGSTDVMEVEDVEYLDEEFRNKIINDLRIYIEIKN